MCLLLGIIMKSVSYTVSATSCKMGILFNNKRILYAFIDYWINTPLKMVYVYRFGIKY